MRKAGFQFIQEKLKDRMQLRIFEVGMIRSKDASFSDGHSTLFWGKLIEGKPDSTLTSVDIDQKCIQETTDIFTANGLSLKNIHLVCADVLHYLESFEGIAKGDINIVYLDGLDCNRDMQASKEFHLKCFELLDPILPSGALVIVDDNLNTETFEGKGQLVQAKAVELGYKLIHNSYMMVLEKGE